MIVATGDFWGTAEEISRTLTAPDSPVTEAMVRNWAARDGLPSIRSTDAAGRPQVRYPLTAAARIEADKRSSGRGRKRVLDEMMSPAA